MRSIDVFIVLISVNTILVTTVGWLIKHELHDIKGRIVRMENIYFQPKGEV